VSFILYHGNCLDQLKLLEDNSIDSIVTDPPYGLSFMGKKWDYDVPSQEVWAECLRVLKPGGHLLAFAGTRTQHRMAVRIEDAGFEIRDMIAWVYGSGFPKSLDVSKAIDKANGKHERDLQPFGDYVKSCRMAKGWPLKKLDEAMGTNTAASWWEGRKSGIQPPGIEQYKKLKTILGMDDRFDELIDWLEAEREVVGQDTKARSTSGASALPTVGGETVYQSWNITAPATEAAKQWEGWGTALKPALEPITVARKPLVGTVAANVLAHGTGGLNIDGCRVETEIGGRPLREVAALRDDVQYSGNSLAGRVDGSLASSKAVGSTELGRWPANLIHDGSDEVVGLFPQTGPAKAAHRGTGKGKSNAYGVYGGESTVRGHDDNGGSAARFFYCAKASKRDRDEGLEGFEAKATAFGNQAQAELKRGNLDHDDGKSGMNKVKLRQNIHPTVKPTDLMRYLCRLVTPPNGVVLDPFMGSGSTGKAAMLEGFQFIGIEREAEYIEIAKARIEAATIKDNQSPQLDLLENV
jgi:DNA modification methylase/transcriptional regulator with XRE-family HTH domain